MQIIKPMRFGILYRTFEVGRKFYLSVASLTFASWAETPDLLSEQDMWKFLKEALPENEILDMALPKPAGEVLAYGKAFATGGEPIPGREVRLRAGAVDKRLVVFGNRYWAGPGAPTDPTPFLEMPVDWAHAFGGPAVETNPLGLGGSGTETENGRPLPNVETPGALVGGPDETPLPASFAPMPLTWPQRMRYAGTYDDSYRDEAFPGYPSDMNTLFFHAAPEDQRLEGFFQGDEAVEAWGMHPTREHLKGVLPALRSRAFVLDTVDGEERLRDMDLKGETVFLFPHAERLIFLQRNSLSIASEDADEVLSLMMAQERMSDPARPLSHYEQALADRRFTKGPPMALLDESPLLPDGEIGLFQEMMQAGRAKAKAEPNQLVENVKAATGRKMAAIEELTVDLGWEKIDTSELQKPVIEIPDLADLSPEELRDAREELMAKAEIVKAEAEEKKTAAKAVMQEFDAMLEEVTGKPKPAGIPEPMSYETLVPRLSLLGNLELIRRQLADIKLELHIDETAIDHALTPSLPDAGGHAEAAAKLESSASTLAEAGANIKGAIARGQEQMDDARRQLASAREQVDATEAQIREILPKADFAFRLSAHHYPAAVPRSDEKIAALREQVQRNLGDGSGCAGMDLCGADLSGLDLSGMDLSDALLFEANLAGARLAGANLTRAALNRAVLDGADLSDANLSEAGLGKASFVNAKLGGADLSQTILEQADFTGADLSGATLADVMPMTQTVFHQADLSGIAFEKTVFNECDFSGAIARGVSIVKASFMQCPMGGADFGGATVSRTCFLKCDMTGARFVEANMTQCLAAYHTVLRESDFTGAILDESCFNETDMRFSTLDGASLQGAFLGKCDLEQASLKRLQAARSLWKRARLTGASFHQANLMEASLRGVDIASATLRGANLYSVDVMRANINDTDFAGSLLDRTLLQDWRPS